VELARLLSEELASFRREEWATQEKRTGWAEILWPKVDEIALTENPNAPVLKKAESYQEQAHRSERLAYSPYREQGAQENARVELWSGLVWIEEEWY
jgi:hypothetical protein